MGFKVGDKVKFNIDNHQIADEFGFDHKKTYEVHNVFHPQQTVQLENDEGIYHAFFYERLELVEPKKTKNQRITELEETTKHFRNELDRAFEIEQEMKKVQALQNDDIQELIMNYQKLDKRIVGLENAIAEQIQLNNEQAKVNGSIIGKLNEAYEKIKSFEFVLAEKSKITGIKPSMVVFDEIVPQEEIIEFEGNQYRKVDREARGGDVIIFRVNETHERHSTVNKPYKVTRIDSTGDARFIGDSKIEYNVYASDHNRTPETVDVYEPIQQEKSPNQQRAEIIEKAKKFVDELVKRGADKDAKTLEKIGNETYQRKFYIVEFKNKPNKVTALVRRANRLGVAKDVNPRHIGSAKCNPSDVFNEHIGKAIALGRALGIDVSEFENVVQPCELVVGQVCEIFDWDGHNGKHTKITRVFDGGKADHSYYAGWLDKNNLKIINDTNAIY